MLKLKLQYFGHLSPLASEELTYLKRLWCWERLKAGREGDDRGWDGWMASLTQWTWVWVKSGSWWWTGKFGMLYSMGLQRVGHDWATELNWKSIFACMLNWSVASDSLQPHWLYPPGSSVHGITQGRILEWVAISSSRGSFQPRIKPMSPASAGRFFTTEQRKSFVLINPPSPNPVKEI